MVNAIAVLALDAADYELARHWDCQNILLDRHAQLETDNHSTDHPLTTEVWPAIATGRDVGEFADIEQEWDNPVLRAASRVTRLLPSDVRGLLGAPFRMRDFGSSFETEQATHPFDELRFWPGIVPATHLDEAWMWLTQVERGDLTDWEFVRNLRANAGEEFGWLAATTAPETPLVGIHSHFLDMAGHMYAERPAELRSNYEWVDRHLGWVRSMADELVILSDHGMQTTALDDEHPGEHSWRAMVAATDGLAGDLPETIYDVAAWLADNRPRATSHGAAGEIDAPREHLEELGYLS